MMSTASSPSVSIVSSISVVSSSMMSTASSPSVSIASSSTIVSLAGERSITRTLNQSNLLHHHLLRSVHALGGSSDDKILLRSIRRRRFVNLGVCPACLVDALDRFAPFADDQPNLTGGHQHILRLL